MKIITAEPLEHFRVFLRFDNEESGTVDLSDLVGLGVFQAWLEGDVFGKLSISPTGALEWPGEIDLCPDSLYMQMTGKSAKEVFPALQTVLVNA